MTGSRTGQRPKFRTLGELPERLRAAILAIFGIDAHEVLLVERSWRVRWHPRAIATTRRNRIYLRGTIEEFASRPDVVLHEYFHVLKQWHSGRLTRASYILEWLRRGYFLNRFEIEAREFTDRQLMRFYRLLSGEPPPPQ